MSKFLVGFRRPSAIEAESLAWIRSSFAALSVGFEFSQLQVDAIEVGGADVSRVESRLAQIHCSTVAVQVIAARSGARLWRSACL